MAGELGHAVFVMKMVGRKLEKFGEMMVKFWLGKGDRSAFVSSGFEKVGTGGKGNRAMNLHEVTKGEGGAHEDERLSRSEVEEKSTKTKFGILQEEAGVVAIIEMAKHVAER